MNARDFMNELKGLSEMTNEIFHRYFRNILVLMDDEIREELHNTGFESEWDFLDAYCDKHLEKYGKEFMI